MFSVVSSNNYPFIKTGKPMCRVLVYCTCLSIVHVRWLRMFGYWCTYWEAQHTNSITTVFDNSEIVTCFQKQHWQGCWYTHPQYCLGILHRFDSLQYQQDNTTIVFFLPPILPSTSSPGCLREKVFGELRVTSSAFFFKPMRKEGGRTSWHQM